MLLLFKYIPSASYAPVTCLGQRYRINKLDNEKGEFLDTLSEVSFLVAKAMKET